MWQKIKKSPSKMRRYLGMFCLSCLGAYVGILGIRYAASDSYLVLLPTSIDLLTWYIGLHFFADWRGFRELAPASAAGVLLGTTLGVTFP